MKAIHIRLQVRRSLALAAVAAVIAAVAPVSARTPSEPATPRAGAESDNHASRDRTQRVILHGGVTEAFLTSLAGIEDYTIIYRYPMIKGIALAVAPAAVDRVFAHAAANGLKAERDAVTHLDLQQSTKTPHVKNSGANIGAWSLGYTGRGVSIAIIDSGIDATHLSLDDIDDDPLTNDPKVVHFRQFAGGVGVDTPPSDDGAHGSHVSGIAAGTGDGSTGDGPRGNAQVGVAYEANLVGLDTFRGAAGSAADALAAFQWLHDNWDNVTPPVRVVNMSFSISGGGITNNGNSSYSQAVDALADVGIVPVASGGNGQCDGGCENVTPGNIAIPSDARKAISVCSSNSAAPPAPPTYSNWDSEGPTADGRPKPEVCAPGDSVLSVLAGSTSAYVGLGGTSMSGPHVAGISALIVQAFPCITPAQVKQSLIETAREYPSHNSERGYGEALARAAILRADQLTDCSALTASAGGPYTTYVGEHAALTGSVVGGTPPVAFAWDLDNDGAFDDATGATPSFTNTAAAGTHTIKVRATDATAGVATGSTTIDVLPVTTVFVDNVEAGVGIWTPAGGDLISGWHRTTIRSNSPTNSWYAGIEATQIYAPSQTLDLTGTVDLTAVTQDQVRFRFARSGSQEPGFDFLRAQIKENSVPTYTTLASFDNYAGGNLWTRHAYDVTAYKGKTVQVRFQFTSDEINPPEFADATGPFIDDISIVGVSAPITDTTPPGSITDLAAGPATETTVPLSWTATGDDGAIGTATAYDLRRSTSPITAGNFIFATPVVGVPVPGPSGAAQSFTVTGLTPNTTYHFAIKAIDDASNIGAFGNSVSIPTLPDTTPPSTVTLSGAAGDTTAQISWTAATDNIGIDHYQVFRDGSPVLNTSGTSAQFTGLTNGTTYAFAVRAFDVAGNAGPLSNLVNLTPQAIRGWPQSRGGSSRTGFTSGSGSITVPQILQTLVMSDTVTSSPLIVDLDGDGDLDVVAVQNMTSPSTRITVRAFKQEPSGLAPMWSYEVPPIPLDPNAPPTPTTGFANLAAGDLNGDGSIEVAVYLNYLTNVPNGPSLNDGQLRILKSDGTLGGTLDLVIGINAAPAVGDVTGDGIPEVVFISQVGGAPPGGGYFVSGAAYDGSAAALVFNTSLGVEAILTPPALVEARSAHPGLEVLVARNAAPLNLYLCSPSSVPTPGSAGCSESIALGVAARGIAARDLDGDAVPEAIVNGQTGSSLQIVRLGAPLSKVSFADGFLWNTASAADVDGDGLAEILNVNYSEFVDDTAKAGDIRVRGWNGSQYAVQGTLPRPPAPGQSSQSRGAGALVNITGDSRPEMVFGTDDAKLAAVSFATGTGAPSALWSLTLPAAVKGPPAVGDVTGDGLLDIVAATTDGRLVVVGAGPLASIVLTPSDASIVAGDSQTYAAEGFDAAGNSLGDVTAATTFAIGPDGLCTGASCTATVAGPHTVTGTNGAAVGTASLSVVPGPVASITLAPPTATITAGGTQAYSATGADQYGNPIGDVTATTTFSIAPNGSCTANSCTATAAGAHTVTGTNGPATATASLTVNAGPPATLTVSPATATISAGGTQAYTATGADQYGNPLGDITATTVFGIAPDGSCAASACTATVAGAHTVTGTNGAAVDTATLTVIAGPLDHIVIIPATASIIIGDSQTYQAEGRDVFENSTGDVTASTTFSIAPDGSCSGNICTPAAIGDHTVTATRGPLAATGVLHVLTDQIARIEISPSSATIIAGGSQAYTAEAFDVNDVSIGDVTASTVFTIGPNGQCAGNTCSAQIAGPHTVTGTAGGVSDVASLQVNPGPASSLLLNPAFATIVTGASQAYTAVARDQFGNVIGNVTASTTFSIAPNGSCTANSCTASVPGSHTVTGVSGAATGTASLIVTPIPPTILTPAEGSLHPSLVDVSGLSPVGTTVDLYDNGISIEQNLVVAPDGSWSVTHSFAHGNHQLKAYAKAGGTTSPASAIRSFRVDGSAPTVTIRKRLGYTLFDPFLPIETVKVSGTARDDDTGIASVEVTYEDFLTGDQVTSVITCSGACGSMSWEDEPALGPGIYDVSAIAVDRAGNRSAPASITIVSTSLVSASRVPGSHGGRVIE